MWSLFSVIFLQIHRVNLDGPHSPSNSDENVVLQL